MGMRCGLYGRGLGWPRTFALSLSKGTPYGLGYSLTLPQGTTYTHACAAARITQRRGSPK